MGARVRIHQKTTTKGSLDRTVLILTIGLTLFGILSVADASAPQALSAFSDPYYFAKQQTIWAFIGIVGMIIVSFIDYRLLKRLAVPVFVVTVLLLMAVIIPGVGSKLLGARRWISVGPATLQPSELAKFSIALSIAYLVEKEKKWHYVAALIGLFAGMIMLQPDLGTTIVVVAIGAGLLFVSGTPFIYLLGLSIVGFVLGFLLIIFSDYRRERLMNFFHNSIDPLGSSYHMKQVLIALGSGGLLGAGIGQSRQKHLFIPETATDSVFAVIAEEVGFVGSVILISVLAFYVMRLFRIAREAPDKFSSILASGIAIWIGSQMFLNLSSMVALTPLTGIPLPFFSYGGSSLVTILLGIGVMLNISKFRIKDKN